MTSFDARLRMIGQTGFPLVVEVDLTGERMTVTAGESELAARGDQDLLPPGRLPYQG